MNYFGFSLWDLGTKTVVEILVDVVVRLLGLLFFCFAFPFG